MTKKIKKIHIQNFQSHEALTLDIAPMLTTIVGASDAGKSAVIRALRWALFNEPTGTQFMRIGTKNTSVLVEFTDGTSLLRARTPSENYYVLRDLSGEPVRLEGFGVSVPEEVTEFTGIHKIQIGEKDSLAVNIAGQLEGPFLLGEKPSVRAEAIGRLAGTDRIDLAHRTANADKFTNQRRIAQLKLDVEKFTDQLEEFADLPALARRIQKLKQLTEKIRTTRAQFVPLEHLQRKHQTHREAYQETEAQLARYAFLSEAMERQEQLETISERLERVRSWERQWAAMENVLQRLREQLEQQSGFLDFIESQRLPQKSRSWISLSALKNQYHRWQKEYHTAKKASEAPVEQMITRLQSLQEKAHRFHALQRILPQWSDRRDRLEKGENYLLHLQGVLAAGNTLQNAEQLHEKMQRFRDFLQRTQMMQDEYRRAEQALHAASDALTDNLDAYISQLKQAKACPYCLQTLDGDSLQHLRYHLERETDELRKRD